MKISDLVLKNFKKIRSADVQLEKINVFVGANNGGKTSFLQGVHFSISVASYKLIGKTETFSVDNLIFNPAHDFSTLRHKSPYGNRKSSDNSSELIIKGRSADDLPFENKIEIRRGRNDGNITCIITGDAKISQIISNPLQPFSIYVPGLAGIPIREELRSKAVVVRAIAGGDSNMYLRNILYFIKKDGKLPELLALINDIFPDHKIHVEFDDASDAFIKIHIENANGESYPFEIAGTGFLQIVQIYSYIAYFKPKILLLDEPDSHLHPDNQKKLCKSIIRISSEYETVICIATHSRHMVEGLSESAIFVRMNDGEIKEQGEGLTRLPLLMDLGALDKYDRLRSGDINLIVLTEDSQKDFVKAIFKGNQFDENKTLVITYNGCTHLHAAIVLVEFMKEVASTSKIIVHRDRDFMTESEVTLIEKKIASAGGIPFITDDSDIESYFINPEVLAPALGSTPQEVALWIDELATDAHVKLQHEFTRKRDELKVLYRDNPTLAPDTQALLGDQVPLPREKRKGKSMMGLINGNMHARFGKSVKLLNLSSAIVVAKLNRIRTSL